MRVGEVDGRGRDGAGLDGVRGGVVPGARLDRGRGGEGHAQGEDDRDAPSSGLSGKWKTHVPNRFSRLS
ncbi:hypothetical protein GCM10023196_021870 [Actinoallomurus vinaceus]|uniref:Uncharacterized protein n=1 Tax=Actinoallomurus vinaceus TaxID=1080074 RepID=A0ABP8U4R0_9ACTN